ncbi:hypothetical protein C8R46DRAFT_1107210 [Mycena filopes]|nr:hypothetical protein C8R46DRAFT_1107210 [Mycena filopes]
MDLTGSTTESYWRRNRVFLESSGYKLRPKFHPGFATNIKELSKTALKDYRARHFHPHIMDAERISDGQKVMLKCVSNKAHPDEVKIAQLFSSPPHAGNPRNHCVPILDVLQDPDDDDKRVLVMPFLLPFHRPGPVFDTVGEVIDCFRQIFEGLQYMHENFVAHRDCGSNNIMQEAILYPAGCHPYNPNDGLPFEEVRLGGDRSPPEHDYIACNHFPTDIYFLGNILKQEFVYSTGPYRSGFRFVRLRIFQTSRIASEIPQTPFKHKPLRFMTHLVHEMTQENPADRPTIGEVIQRFDKLCRKLGWWHLRRSGEYTFSSRWLQWLKRAVTRVPALPPYTPPPATPLSVEMQAFFTQTDQVAVIY